MVDRVQVPAEDNIKTNDGTQADNTEGTSKDELILGKFKSYEDLEKSYKELEAKLGNRGKAEEPADEIPQAKPKVDDEWQKEEKPATMEEVKSLLPGFTEDKISEMSQYAWEHGSLTEDHYAELEKAGYSKDIVDQFMAGQFAVAQAQQAQLINAGGGAEQVEAMFAWAAQNLPQDQIDRYNERFDRGGPDAIMAMEHLVAKYQSSGEAGGRRVAGANAPLGDGVEPFRSVAQVTQAMSDPRYQTDPAYRDEVARRLAKSNVL